MKNKLVVVCCAVSVLVSAAALLSSLAGRAHAAASPSTTLTVIASDAETRIYSFESGGHQCFLASTVGGSGVSLQCPR